MERPLDWEDPALAFAGGRSGKSRATASGMPSSLAFSRTRRSSQRKQSAEMACRGRSSAVGVATPQPVADFAPGVASRSAVTSAWSVPASTRGCRTLSGAWRQRALRATHAAMGTSSQVTRGTLDVRATSWFP